MSIIALSDGTRVKVEEEAAKVADLALQTAPSRALFAADPPLGRRAHLRSPRAPDVGRTVIESNPMRTHAAAERMMALRAAARKPIVHPTGVHKQAAARRALQKQAGR